MQELLKHIKVPSGELLLYVALCLAGAIYIAVQYPTFADEDKTIKTAIAILCVIEAGLLFFRFRWSPEIYIGFFLFVIGWGLLRSANDGFTNARIIMIAGSACALLSYPTLRQEVRGRSAPEAE